VACVARAALPTSWPDVRPIGGGRPTPPTNRQDAAALWAELYGAERAPTLLVGHSMGGAVAVRLAAAPQARRACRPCLPCAVSPADPRRVGCL
jgi:pimeloyl-ACP methyl ester carboxylesterase